jgi:hypothetical protein
VLILESEYVIERGAVLENNNVVVVGCAVVQNAKVPSTSSVWCSRRQVFGTIRAG